MNKILLNCLIALVIGVSSMVHAMSSLNDESLSEVTGQALFTLSKETDAGQGLDFFKLGLQAELSLNTNIKSLQLGCGGENGAGGCDVDISNLSFGCVANASGSCITLPAVAGQPTGIDSNNAISNQAALKDFVLTNPFFQFAIKGGSQASTREVVGVRVGAEKAVGPMSVGTLNSFSGYLTGKTNLTMLGEQDVAATCKLGTGCSASEASKFQDASAFLGLKIASVLDLGMENEGNGI